MDERVEEIKPISRISPTRKVAIAKPRRGRRELMYQFSRYQKAQKRKATNLTPKRMPDHPKSAETSSCLNTNDVTDIKKRVAYDRAMIIGD